MKTQQSNTTLYVKLLGWHLYFSSIAICLGLINFFIFFFSIPNIFCPSKQILLGEHSYLRHEKIFDHFIIKQIYLAFPTFSTQYPLCKNYWTDIIIQLFLIIGARTYSTPPLEFWSDKNEPWKNILFPHKTMKY